MADTFVELLVARKTPTYATPVKFGLIALEAVSFILGFMQPLMFILMIILILVSIFVVPKFNVEFEYAFIGDQLNVDIITNMSNRKKAGEYEMARVDIVAPENSSELAGFLQNPNNKGKVVDYTSKTGEGKVYGILYNGDKEKFVVLIEPDDKLLNAMKYQSPRKVIL